MSAESPCDLRAFFYQLVHSIAVNPCSVDVIQRKQNEQLVLTVFVAEEDLRASVNRAEKRSALSIRS